MFHFGAEAVKSLEVKKYTKETDLCADFIAAVPKEWEVYAETAGFDILLSRKSDGLQIGIEAKLSLNAEVINQAIEGLGSYWGDRGPDFRAVLVPEGKTAKLGSICGHIGITVFTTCHREGYAGKLISGFSPRLPTEEWELEKWHHWMPLNRCVLPGYIPDVAAGSVAPLALTDWKIKAIKLAVILEQRPLTRADFKFYQVSPSRWTERSFGWLSPTPQGYVANKRMPDFKSQHPVNYEQIKSDIEIWRQKT
jgi:hypothetical protein